LIKLTYRPIGLVSQKGRPSYAGGAEHNSSVLLRQLADGRVSINLTF